MLAHLSHLIFLALPLLSRAKLSPTCSTAVDHLNPIYASSVLEALAGPDVSLDTPRLSAAAAAAAAGHGPIVELAQALREKILWDIPASGEKEADDRLAQRLPAVWWVSMARFYAL